MWRDVRNGVRSTHIPRHTRVPRMTMACESELHDENHALRPDNPVGLYVANANAAIDRAMTVLASAMRNCWAVQFLPTQFGFTCLQLRG